MIPRAIPARAPEPLWEAELPGTTRPFATPVIGDGRVLFPFDDPDPTALAVLDLWTGETRVSVEAPERRYRTGTPAAGAGGRFALALEGLARGGLYVVVGEGDAARVETVDPPPEGHTGGMPLDGWRPWAVPADPGVIAFSPAPWEVEWRWLEGDRERVFHERPVGATEDLVVTSSASHVRVRRRGDGAQVWSMPSRNFLTVGGPRVVLAGETRLTRSGDGAPRSLLSVSAADRWDSFRIPVEEELVSILQAPHLLLLAVVDPQLPERAHLRRVGHEGRVIGDSLLSGKARRSGTDWPWLLAADHTNLLWCDRTRLVAESLLDPGSHIWDIALPDSCRPSSSLRHPADPAPAIACADGVVVMRSGRRVWAFG